MIASNKWIPLRAVAAGNTTGRMGADHSYNHANRMSGISTVYTGGTFQDGAYLYNALGLRVQKESLSTAWHFIYSPDNKYLSVRVAPGAEGQRREYVYLNEVPIAAFFDELNADDTITSTRTTYIHADHLSTPRIVTDRLGSVVWRWEHDAFGKYEPITTLDADGKKNEIDLRFPGQVADSETGLFYNINRYYDPFVGRYSQSDPIGLAGGVNTYAYVSGNPISATDPLGLLENFTLTLNSQPVTQLQCECGDKYEVFSGQGDAVDDPTHTANTDIGPIPQGEYYITARVSGGTLGGLRDAIRGLGGNDPTKWFTLLPKDGDNDCRVVNGVVRCGFRMHPGSRSKGCVTFKKESEFFQMRERLLKTTPGIIPGTQTIYYGTVSVQ